MYLEIKDFQRSEIACSETKDQRSDSSHILEIYLLTTENLNMLTMKVTDNKVPYTVVL